MQRASRYATAADYLQRANDEVCVIAQLESEPAVAALEEIAAIPGIDAVFIGPGDLSASMGFLGNPGAEPVQELLAKAAGRAVARNTPCGSLAGTPELARRHMGHGCRFVAVSTDLAILLGGARTLLAQVRQP